MMGDFSSPMLPHDTTQLDHIGRHVRHMQEAVPETWTKALSSTGAEEVSCPGLSFSVTQTNAGTTIAGKRAEIALPLVTQA